MLNMREIAVMSNLSFFFMPSLLYYFKAYLLSLNVQKFRSFNIIMIQEIIVYVIGIVVAIFLLSKVYKALFSKKEKQGLGCSCHCSSSAQYNKKAKRISF